MAVLLPVLLPPILFTLLVVSLLFFYTSRIFFGSPKKRKAAKPGNDGGTDVGVQRSTSDVELGKPLDVVLEFWPQSIRWDRICLTVKAGESKRDILKGCAGECLPGEMLAIVGPSGAGKSTLLDILAARVKPTGGQIMVDGSQQDASFKRISSYVPQEDTFVPTLSVWETLGLNASLRLPSSIKKAQRRAIMTDILQSMGLAKVKHSQVGGLLPGGLFVRGLSGGERRRLNISCGIVAAPSIIFLDEPTSGLDSHAALVLMEYMRKLTSEQRTVVCSIHQPRQAIWEMFHKVEVLSEGHLMYFGSTTGAVAWFGRDLGYCYNPTQDGTPSDWLLDLVSIGFGRAGGHSEGMSSLAEVGAAAERFRLEALPGRMTTSEPLGKESPDPVTSAGTTVAVRAGARCEACRRSWCARPSTQHVPTYPTSFWNQLMVLTWRALMAYIRNPADVIGRLLMSLVVGLIVGIVFIKANADGMGLIPVLSVIFFSALTILLLPFAQMSLYVADRQFFIADVAANLYRPSAYYLAQTLASSPFNICSGLVLFLVMYGMVGLRYSATAIWITIAVIALYALVSIQVLVLAAYITPNQDMAFVVATTYVVMSILLSGFLVRLQDLLAPMRVLSIVTPCRYAIQILVNQQFAGTTRASTMKFYDIRVPVPNNFGALIAIYVFFHIATFLALQRLHRIGRK